jgi:hypothetical protein
MGAREEGRRIKDEKWGPEMLQNHQAPTFKTARMALKIVESWHLPGESVTY